MMGWIKMVQAFGAYTAGLIYAYQGEYQLAWLCFIGAVLCDIGHILGEKE